MGLKITSVLVISMLLCSRHNAAVLDELSCCPSVGDWVSLGGWVAGRAQMKDMFSSHLGTGGLTGWLLATWSTARSQQKLNNCITLINLPRGLKKREAGVYFFTLYFYTLTVLYRRTYDPWGTTLRPRTAVTRRQSELQWSLSDKKTCLSLYSFSLKC